MQLWLSWSWICRILGPAIITGTEYFIKKTFYWLKKSDNLEHNPSDIESI